MLILCVDVVEDEVEVQVAIVVVVEENDCKFALNLSNLSRIITNLLSIDYTLLNQTLHLVQPKKK